MSFQMKDETAGLDILYIDNSGNMGLGGLPTNSQAITIGANGVVSPLAIFTGPIAVAGVPINNTGQIIIGPGSSSSVTIEYILIPSVSATQNPSNVSPTSVTWTNPSTGGSLTVTYGTW